MRKRRRSSSTERLRCCRMVCVTRDTRSSFSDRSRSRYCLQTHQIHNCLKTLLYSTMPNAMGKGTDTNFADYLMCSLDDVMWSAMFCFRYCPQTQKLESPNSNITRRSNTAPITSTDFQRLTIFHCAAFARASGHTLGQAGMSRPLKVQSEGERILG